jgi:hypothetical protein
MTSWKLGPVRQSQQLPHFFREQCYPEQRSQSGLLRALLYETLNKHRELVPIVLPWQWATEYSRHLKGVKNKRSQLGEFWHISKLKAAFQILVSQKVVPIKMCWFIDGLDEYEGDHEEINELFRSLAASNAMSRFAFQVALCWSLKTHLALVQGFDFKILLFEI